LVASCLQLKKPFTQTNQTNPNIKKSQREEEHMRDVDAKRTEERAGVSLNFLPDVSGTDSPIELAISSSLYSLGVLG
jgi:hypothetical protein